MPISPEQAVLAATIVAVGAFVQSSIGLGSALIASPLLLLIDDRFAPGPMITANLLLTLLVARREWQDVDWRGLAMMLSGRLLGTVPAIALLTVASQALFDASFGLVVLIAVGLSYASGSPRITQPLLFVAGIGSGFMGTLSSIGGPAMALAYQSAPPARFRATLAMQLLFGGLVSVAALALFGHYGGVELELAGLLLPGIAIGFGLSRFSVGWLTARTLRPAVLVLASAAGVLVLWRAGRALLGPD